MATSSVSRRLTIVAVVQLAFLSLMFAAVAFPLWAGQTLLQQVVLALLVWVLGVFIGWRGAIWVRAARQEMPEPPGFAAARWRFMARARTVFAVAFGVSGAVLAPFAPRLAELPFLSAMLLGAAGGALGGLAIGQFFGAQSWITETSRFTPTGASNKSLERTRER
jgi:hypothetical protein